MLSGRSEFEMLKPPAVAGFDNAFKGAMYAKRSVFRYC